MCKLKAPQEHKNLFYSLISCSINQSLLHFHLCVITETLWKNSQNLVYTQLLNYKQQVTIIERGHFLQETNQISLSSEEQSQQKRAG